MKWRPDATPKDYPLLYMFTDDTQYQALAKQLEKVPASVIREIVEIQYPNDTKNSPKIYLKMKDGNRVIGNLKDIGDKLGYYPSITKQLNGKKGTVIWKWESISHQIRQFNKNVLNSLICFFK